MKVKDRLESVRTRLKEIRDMNVNSEIPSEVIHPMKGNNEFQNDYCSGQVLESYSLDSDLPASNQSRMDFSKHKEPYLNNP